MLIFQRLQEVRAKSAQEMPNAFDRPAREINHRCAGRHARFFGRGAFILWESIIGTLDKTVNYRGHQSGSFLRGDVVQIADSHAARNRDFFLCENRTLIGACSDAMDGDPADAIVEIVNPEHG